jgi:CRISPR/Cas system-associated endonuclease Cas3-HD
MKKIVVILLCSYPACFILAQDKILEDKKDIDTFCVRFMQKFIDIKPDESIKLLKEYSVIEKNKLDDLLSTIHIQLNTMKNAFGEMISFEFIKEKEIKDFLLKKLFILKFDKLYLKFEFLFYNNGNGWKVTGFYYNESIDELFDNW